MTISAKIIADSMSPDGIRLTTMQLRYPRFIHAEFMTHRVFSRNASSSRAIPVSKMIEDLRRDPAMPVYWGANQKGMQARAELTGDDRGLAHAEWFDALDCCIHAAEEMVKLGLHKQIANRILEPWAHINVLVTATEWDNFFELRAHKDAQPEIKALADAMWNAMSNSEPNSLEIGEWHLPFIHWRDHFSQCHQKNDGLDILKKVSVARCARVSYLTHDGRRTPIEEDLALYERLVGSEPLHASPAEHQATPDEQWNNMGQGFNQWKAPNLHGNFTGWIQNRKLLEGIQ